MKTSVPPEAEAEASVLSATLGISDEVIGYFIIIGLVAILGLTALSRKNKRRGHGDSGGGYFDGDIGGGGD
jgi:hypothetical protein